MHRTDAGGRGDRIEYCSLPVDRAHDVVETSVAVRGQRRYREGRTARWVWMSARVTAGPARLDCGAAMSMPRGASRSRPEVSRCIACGGARVSVATGRDVSRETDAFSSGRGGTSSA